MEPSSVCARRLTPPATNALQPARVLSVSMAIRPTATAAGARHCPAPTRARAVPTKLDNRENSFDTSKAETSSTAARCSDSTNPTVPKYSSVVAVPLSILIRKVALPVDPFPMNAPQA